MNILSENRFMKYGNTMQAFIWNMGGTCFLYLCRWLVTIAVVRMSNDFNSAGMLILAISITNIWNVVAVFAGRNIQVSDIKNEYADKEYISIRVLTILLALVLCAVHVLILSNEIYQSFVIVIYMFVILGIAYSDVLHGILQKQWRMDLIGISCVVRGVLFLGSFIVFFHFFNLLVAVIAMAFISLAIVFLLDMPLARMYADITLSFDLKRLIRLAKVCFPLVIVAFLFNLIPSFTRIMLARQTDIEMLGIYGSVTLPAAMAQTIAISAFAPIINMMTKSYQEKKYKSYLRIFWMGIIGISAVFLSFYALSLPFGGWFLRLLFDAEVAQYAQLFSEAIFFSMFMSLGWFIMIPLTVFRKTVVQATIYAGGAIICLSLASFMIRLFGASGANYIQIISNATIFILLLVVTIVISKKQFADLKKNNPIDEEV
ncbi:MAG: hypothetical protein FWD05_04375 [Oscillospiraceae bacterium]|nr:hypothetical protein [Oscillospiraceae bacterium]